MLELNAPLPTANKEKVSIATAVRAQVKACEFVDGYYITSSCRLTEQAILARRVEALVLKGLGCFDSAQESPEVCFSHDFISCITCL